MSKDTKIEHKIKSIVSCYIDSVRVQKYLIDLIKDYFIEIIGRDDDEIDGWKVFFNKNRCCPGDDISFARNQLRQQLRDKVKEL